MLERFNPRTEQPDSPLQESLKKLYQPFHLSSAKPLVETHRQEKGLDRPINQETLRRECLAISGYFIENIWRHSKDWIKQHPPGVASISIDAQNRVHLLPNPHDPALDPAQHPTPAKVIATLNEWMGNTLSHGLIELARELQAGARAEEKPYANRAIERYEALLYAMTGDPNFDSLQHIQQGINVALRLIGSFFANLPTVIHAKTQRSVEPQEARRIAQNSVQTIRLIASMYVNSLNQFEQLMGEDEQHLYLAKNLTLVGAGEDARLEPAPEIHEAITRAPLRQNQRIGCPSFYATDRDGKNVIDSVYNWYLQVADVYYFPRIRELAQNLKE